jgi:hypothetical protein
MRYIEALLGFNIPEKNRTAWGLPKTFGPILALLKGP